MIEWFKAWSKEIVISVIIVTVIEMILPSNNMKKFVKVVMGLFIMYTILYPVIEVITDSNYSDNFGFYGNTSNVLECSAKIENERKKSNGIMSSIYTKNLKQDINNRLRDLGYECKSTSLIIDEESFEIKELAVEIKSKDPSKKKAYSIVKTVEYICVSVTNKNNMENSVIDENDRLEIKDFISETYGVNIDNINVY